MCSADLLEDRRPHQPAACCTATRSPRSPPASRCPRCSTPRRPGTEAEAAQPFTRATGCITAARPLGGLPAVAYLHRTPGRRGGLRGGAAADRASDCTDTEVRGTLTLVCPHGWVGPGQLPVTLRPGEYRKPTWP
ncbi:putative alpha-mannosidase [Mycobacterium xenopi 4042]|uniref:Putative alpha-mannosidase n=1 Tax=Mycobacterium xenopi 4042 TaxID=1299334 RepID=X8DD27_MYCXE|nr:putative alpha-mannosidase [Mycobacterium xenopi 4042]